MRRCGFIISLLMAVAWCGPATADSRAGCADFCVGERNAFLKKCGEQDQCREVAAQGLRHCLEGCGKRLEQVPRKITYQIARAEALKTLGSEIELIHWASYTNSGHETSRLYVFATSESQETLRSVLRSLEEGIAPEAFDDTILSVETGVNGLAPPKIAFWKGLPLEIRRLPAMSEWSPLNAVNFTDAISSRHGGALYPSLGLFDHRGETLLFDARRGVPKDDYRATLSYRPATPGTRRSHLIRRHWLYEMEQLKAEEQR